MRATLVCLFTFVTMLFASLTALGQSAQISGAITDPTGAVVPKAEVRIVNQDTHAERKIQTNEAGYFTAPFLEVGTYVVYVSAAGFSTSVSEPVVVHVGDALSLNMKLKVGAATETVTVEGGAPMINTTDAAVSTVVDQTYVKNMPLNGRSFQSLILLTPGIVTNSPQISSDVGQRGEFSVNGQRTEANYYTVDGVSANVGVSSTFLGLVTNSGASGSVPAATALGTTQALVSVDDLQEFRVQSSTYSAAYGRNPGGQFAFETKSGTNQWHGTAYDYLRNDLFDANDWFNGYFQSSKPPIRQNDFGGTLGGPVKIPRLYDGKDKTFFFASYEGLRLTAPQPATPSFVPDLCMRGKGPCPSGRNPAPAALQPALNAFALPNTSLEDAANGFGQFVGSGSNPSLLNSTSVRFDHVISEKLRLFFRFSDTGSNSKTRSSNTATMNRISDNTARTYTAGASGLPSSRLSNDFRLNYSSNEGTGGIVIDAFGGSTPVSLVQLSGLSATSAALLRLIYKGYFLDLQQQHEAAAQRQWNFVDTVSLSLGHHQFRFGADYRRLMPFDIHSGNINYLYLSEAAVEANNAQLIFETNFAPAYPLYTNFSAFAQDEWRVLPRLNLSMGLRWEVNPAPGVTQGFKPYTIQGSGPNTWALAPQGTPLWQTTWYNFAPRLGVAYILHEAPGWETVVRGGGGVFFDTGQQAGSLGFQGPASFATSASLSGPFPTNGPALIPAIVNPPVGRQGNVYAFAAHLQLPYTLQWTASIEQALGNSQALTVSYIGSHGSRLLKLNKVSTPNNPNVATVYLFQNGLTSDYGSLQVQFQRRLARGLTALASYTWSHCIDYGSSNLDFGYLKGDCDFDVRHNLSAAFSYDLPNVGHNGFVNAMMHHWGLDDRFTMRTGFPVTLKGNTIVDPFTGQNYYAGLNLVPGQPAYLYGANCDSTLQALGDLTPGHGCPGGRAINPNAFVNVSSALGTAPRNFARGFGAWQMDLAVRRDFPIHERLKLQFRAEAFNIFNHPNFGTINSSFGQKTFGQATGTLALSLGALNSLYQTGGPRSMQFALKLVF